MTDWSLTPHGSTAVAKFVDVLTQKIGTQTVQYSFLSTEVWQKKKGRWLMISSQTLALQQDPVAVTLPAAMLDQYVGEYKMSDNLIYRISRDGDHRCLATFRCDRLRGLRLFELFEDVSECGIFHFGDQVLFVGH